MKGGSYASKKRNYQKKHGKNGKKAAPIAKRIKKPGLKNFPEEVEKRAYDLYLKRIKSGISSDEMSDWFHAELEIKEKYKL